MSRKKHLKKTPVFVFLDENNSCARFQKLKSAQVNKKYDLKIIPFPSEMEYIGLWDYQVIFHIKKHILNGRYPIREILYRTPRPIFLFITFDRAFIRDAEEGFQIWIGKSKNAKKRKSREEQVRRIKLYEDAIMFRLDNGYMVNVSVRYLKGGINDTQEVILSKSIKLLEEFLA